MVDFAEKVDEIIKKALIMDGHCDTLLKITNDSIDITQDTYEHWDLVKAEIGGLKAQVFAAFIEEKYKPHFALKRGLELINTFHEVIGNQEKMDLVLKAGDISESMKKGKIACILAIEGGEAIEEDLFLLDIFYRLGVRSIGLTWNQRNAIADGVGERETGGGLTRFGKEVVQRMNTLGIAVDVSHLSEAGFWSVIETSSKPIWASHSNCFSLCQHPRNLKDSQIKAIAKNSGVIGMNFYPAFVQSVNPSFDHLLDHIDYISNLIGNSNNISLGSDFDGIDEVIPGLENLTSISNIIEGLLKRGYSEIDIKGILGENMLKFFRIVW